MSTFNDERLISGLVDGELSHQDRQRAQEFVRDSAEAEKRYQAMRSLSTYMQRQTVPNLEESAERVRRRLDYSLRGRRQQFGWWHRTVPMPIPFAAAAAAAVLTIVAFVLGPSAQKDAEVSGFASSGSAVNLRIQVDGQQTQDLLNWLDQQQSVDTVTIELPESAEFSFMGEPVLMRARDREEPRLVPLGPEDLDDSDPEPGPDRSEGDAVE